MSLGYEVFAGNRGDVTTVKETVAAMESKYGQASRIWVMDRGMVPADNLEFLQRGGRRYILGTPKSLLRKFRQPLLAHDWREMHEGLEIKLPGSPPLRRRPVAGVGSRAKRKGFHPEFPRPKSPPKRAKCRLILP